MNPIVGIIFFLIQSLILTATMVPVRPSPRDNGHSSRKTTIFGVSAALLALPLLYFIVLQQQQREGVMAAEAAGGERAGALKTTATAELVELNEGRVRYGSRNDLPYYHCGELPSESNAGQLTEIVMLHGAAFTKENWKSSGILEKLCAKQYAQPPDASSNTRSLASTTHPLSVTALDLPVQADGYQFAEAFDALVSNNVLRGTPVTVVSPSASGKAIVSLGEMAADSSLSSEENGELKRLVKAWIPVAAGRVLQTSKQSLQSFQHSDIPILAIHGDKDRMGRETTNTLVSSSGARGVELVGRHPCYLDSPVEFVDQVFNFVVEKKL